MYEPRPVLLSSMVLRAMSRHARETAASCILEGNWGIDCSGPGNERKRVRFYVHEVKVGW